MLIAPTHEAERALLGPNLAFVHKRVGIGEAQPEKRART